MDFDVKITGLDEVMEKFKTFPPDFARRVLRRDMRTACAIFQEEIAQNAPRLSAGDLSNRASLGLIHRKRKSPLHYPGELANSIGMESRVNSDLEGTVKVGPSRHAFWAYFLERGTRKMRARPFIRPAFESNASKVLDKFVEEAKKTLAGMGLPEGNLDETIEPTEAKGPTFQQWMQSVEEGVLGAMGQMAGGIRDIILGLLG